jgi:hypothetical protein
MEFIHPGDHLIGFVVVACVLYIDRAMCTLKRILDGNALLSYVLAARVVNHMRVYNHWSEFAMHVVSGVWCVFGCLLIMEPKCIVDRVRENLLHATTNTSALWWASVVPVVMTSVFTMFLVYTHMAEEDSGFKFFRGISFVILSSAWVYSVGVWRQRGTVCDKSVYLFGNDMVGRFAPILFVPPLMALIYVVVGLSAVTWFHMFVVRRSSFARMVPPTDDVMDVVETKRIYNAPLKEEKEEEDDDVLVFSNALLQHAPSSAVLPTDVQEDEDESELQGILGRRIGAGVCNGPY